MMKSAVVSDRWTGFEFQTIESSSVPVGLNSTAEEKVKFRQVYSPELGSSSVFAKLSLREILAKLRGRRRLPGPFDTCLPAF